MLGGAFALRYGFGGRHPTLQFVEAECSQYSAGERSGSASYASIRSSATVRTACGRLGQYLDDSLVRSQRSPFSIRVNLRPLHLQPKS
jgi:hypothetical protein